MTLFFLVEIFSEKLDCFGSRAIFTAMPKQKAWKVRKGEQCRSNGSLNATRAGKPKPSYWYEKKVNMFKDDLDDKIVRQRTKRVEKVEEGGGVDLMEIEQGEGHPEVCPSFISGVSNGSKSVEEQPVQIVLPRRIFRKSLSELGRSTRLKRMGSVRNLAKEEFRNTTMRVQSLSYLQCGVVLKKIEVSCVLKTETSEGECESRLHILSDHGILDMSFTNWRKCPKELETREVDRAHLLLYTFCRQAVSTRTFQDILSASDSSVKAYRVWELKKKQNEELDNLVPIRQIMPSKDAFYMSPEKLLKYILPGMYESDALQENDVTVCLSGDGRNMKILREPSSIIISLKISAGNPHETKYLFPIALARGQENRENIELIMSKLRADLMRLKYNGIRIGERRVKIRLAFCADGKFLLMILGLKAAQAKFSCPYCVLHKDHWVKKLDKSNFDIRDELRSPIDLSRRTGGGNCPHHNSPQACKSSAHGVKSENLLQGLVDLKDIFIDELHLFLRLWDLLRNYILAFCEQYELQRYIKDTVYCFALFMCTRA